jgi:hypothetical protein
MRCFSGLAAEIHRVRIRAAQQHGDAFAVCRLVAAGEQRGERRGADCLDYYPLIITM